MPEKKTRVGITGQSGFIGTHLYNYLGLDERVERIPFRDDFFQNKERLSEFVQQCDVLVHLAAVNRHSDPQTLYDTNIGLAQQIIDVLAEAHHRPHVVFSSSIQEHRDNLYGASKRKCRELFIEWAKNNDASFAGLVIPNVFGPFGKPFYNSVISTFSYQLIHNETPEIQVDAELPLIYITILLEKIKAVILDETTADEHYVEPQTRMSVSEILNKLQDYNNQYVKMGVIPEIAESFDLAICLPHFSLSGIPVMRMKGACL